MGRRKLVALGFAVVTAFAYPVAAQQSTYVVYVASEAADKITLVRFGPDGTVVDREIPTGMMPTDIDGPHGLAVSPDKRYYYVSIAHGQPNGSLWKYSTNDDKLVGRVTLGMFPATLDISPDGDFLLRRQLQSARRHGSVERVGRRPEDMTEIARIPDVHHAAWLAAESEGTQHYSVCMMDEQLVEIDTRDAQSVAPFHSDEGAARRECHGTADADAACRPCFAASGHGTEAPNVPATYPALRPGLNRRRRGDRYSWRATDPAR